MITDNNRKATIMAYYFSKFDRDAMRKLGYTTLTDAFSVLSKKFGKDNQYLKLRRDEFDPLTGSHRAGFNKRNPNAVVTTFHNGLKNYSFEELTMIVRDLIDDTQIEPENIILLPKEKELITQFSEYELESIINAKDDSATIRRQVRNVNQRVFDNTIPNNLKKLYSYRCQICGESAILNYCVDITEAHHIKYFSESMNNNARNIVILCPDHHIILHKTKAMFNSELKQFVYSSGRVDNLEYNIHL